MTQRYQNYGPEQKPVIDRSVEAWLIFLFVILPFGTATLLAVGPINLALLGIVLAVAGTFLAERHF